MCGVYLCVSAGEEGEEVRNRGEVEVKYRGMRRAVRICEEKLTVVNLIKYGTFPHYPTSRQIP